MFALLIVELRSFTCVILALLARLFYFRAVTTLLIFLFFQNYNAAPNGSLTVASYSMSNYYGASYPYPAYCVGDGATTWPNNEGITYMSDYNGQMAPAEAAYGMEGMFGTAFGAPFGQTAAPNATSFNYFPGSAEYPAWETSASLPPMADKQYQEYYRENLYDSSKTMKGLDQRLHNLDINADTNSNKMLDASKYCYGVVKPDPYTNSVPQTVEKKTTWASIAKQPAKPMPQTSSTGTKKKGPGMPPPPIVLGRHNIDLNTWEVKNNNVSKPPVAQAPPPPPSVNSLAKPIWNGPIISPEPPSEPIMHMNPNTSAPPPLLPCTAAPPPPLAQKIYTNSVITNRPPPQAPAAPVYQAPPPQPIAKAPVSTSPPQRQLSSSPVPVQPSSTTSSSSPNALAVSPHSVVDKLKDKNNYNPSELELPPKGTRFFVIKSYSEDDVHRSIKYEIWCSTEHGNKRLDDAFNDQKAFNGAVYLFFSVNGSGHFCGVARMISAVDYGASSSVWAQDKWKGQFRVRWIYVKDVPNGQLRHIRLENNENKPVTNSRDTQEVPYDKGVGVLKIIHSYSHTTSIFDDFTHYEKRQEEGDCIKRAPPPPIHQPPHRNNAFNTRSSQNKVNFYLR